MQRRHNPEQIQNTDPPESVRNHTLLTGIQWINHVVDTFHTEATGPVSNPNQYYDPNQNNIVEQPQAFDSQTFEDLVREVVDENF
ncbi:MAG TPA: hypothetical protein VMR34_05185 [Candidatus Saccharimonadales bacterium]|jgi:hypothetical protein|nr:hypothetical protein [Candidatus Saccharimonadales bacterium]